MWICWDLDYPANYNLKRMSSTVTTSKSEGKAKFRRWWSETSKKQQMGLKFMQRWVWTNWITCGCDSSARWMSKRVELNWCGCLYILWLPTVWTNASETKWNWPSCDKKRLSEGTQTTENQEVSSDTMIKLFMYIYTDVCVYICISSVYER